MPSVASLGDLHMAVAHDDYMQQRAGIHQREQVIDLEREIRCQVSQVDAVRMFGNHIQQARQSARCGIRQRPALDLL